MGAYHQARSQDFSLGVRGCVWEVKIQTCRVGGSGGMLPGKILEIWDCLGLHFARFHGGERECRVVKRKSQSQALDLLKI